MAIQKLLLYLQALRRFVIRHEPTFAMIGFFLMAALLYMLYSYWAHLSGDPTNIRIIIDGS